MRYYAANDDDIIPESHLTERGTVNIWSPGRIKKYLRKYSLGAGEYNYLCTNSYDIYSSGKSKHRYYKKDIFKAREEALAGSPKDENGCYLNASLDFLQGQGRIV